MCDFIKFDDIDNLNDLSQSIGRENTEIDGFELEISQPSPVVNNSETRFSPYVYIKKKNGSGYFVYNYSKGVKIIPNTTIDTTDLTLDLKKLLLTLGQ